MELPFNCLLIKLSQEEGPVPDQFSKSMEAAFITSMAESLLCTSKCEGHLVAQPLDPEEQMASALSTASLVPSECSRSKIPCL